MTDLFGSSSAIFSECRTYRYALWRWWDKEKRYLMVIGLNPSTADETKDDPTVRRCKQFASDWGFGGLCMMNLFAFRATKPAVMMAYASPVGDENDKFLVESGTYAGIILAAWGIHGAHMARDYAVRRLIEKRVQMRCLGTTKAGQPRHPLYIKATTKPVVF